jgi:L-fucose isomerase-like protein
VKSRIGAEVIPVTIDDVIQAHKAVDAKAAESEAEAYWLTKAKKIVEPSREEIVKSAAMYLAMKNLMIEREAQAITIACLGGIPIDVLGYPCLGFSKLNDIGLVGACEADMDSTLTMLAFTHAFGVPGFISDPLFDVSRNAVIHAHCLAPSKMDGPAGERAPFLIRTHRDDNRGASLEVELRVGQEITCAKLCNLDTMLLSAGKIIDIPDYDDRGCRTQAVTQVADARKMVDEWGSGVLENEGMMTLLHRVVFYGNHVENVRHLSTLMGWKVIQEG